MAERGKSPIELFRAGESELLGHAATHREARDHQLAVEGKLKEAERKTSDARNALNDYGGALLGQIHDAVTEETDPGEYLQAILNTYHSGARVGDEVISRLAPMRTQIRQSTIPVGVIGTAREHIRLGLSAGDIIVRRKDEYENEFDVASGVRLEVPMAGMNSLNPGFLSSSEPVWEYRGGRPEPYSVGVKQWLSKLRLASTEAEVQEFNEMPHAPFRQYDTVMHHEREIKDHTGFVPFIAYGETAVSGLLAALYEGREIASHYEHPRQDDVIAAAISLGITPEAVTLDDIEAIKARLHEQFVGEVANGVKSVIHIEAYKRQFPNSGSSTLVGWPIVASPQVMEYVGVEQDKLIRAMRDGIERSIDEIRVDDEDDQPIWYEGEKDYRLLEDEAREKAIGLVAVRYDITVKPSELRSDTLTHQLAKRLEEKRERRQRIDMLHGRTSRL